MPVRNGISTSKGAKKGGSDGDDDFDKLFEDEDDDEFFKQWAKDKKEALQTLQTTDPYQVLLEYLRKTKLPYAIIGGKAAAFYLSAGQQNTSVSLMQLATSTNDYDIIVPFTSAKKFIEELQTKLRKKSDVVLDEQWFHGKMVDILLMGVKKNQIMNSIVDIHIPHADHANHFPKNVARGTDNLVYASKDWICKELAFSMKYHASQDEFTKTIKRQARHELLQCPN